MKNECDVICDLLPLYRENLLSEESIRLVESHIKTCKKCQEFQEDREVEKKNVDKGVILKQFFERRKKNSILFAFLCVYSIVVLIAYIEGRFFLRAGDEMGYGLLFFYFLLPAVSCVTAAVYVYYTKIIGVLVAGAIGLFEVIIPNVIFSHGNVWSGISDSDLLLGMLPAAFGMVIGIVFGVYSYIGRKIKERQVLLHG